MFSEPAATTTAPASTVCARRSASTYSTPVASPPSIRMRSTFAFARSSSSPAASASWMYVFIVDLPAFVGQPWRHEPQRHAVRVRVRAHGLELGAERAEARLERVDALPPVRALAHAEPRLDPVVVRIEVGGGERRAVLFRQPGRRLPLGDVPVVRAQRDLRVDRRRAADAAAGEERDEPCLARRREPERPPHVVRRLRLPAREVGGRQVRAGLEQEHVAAPLGELAGDDASARARADDDDLEGSFIATPRYDQSFASRVASGELKSISVQAPGPGLPGATKSE